MVKIIITLSVLLLAQQQQPTFKSGVELVAVDVHVVDKQRGHGRAYSSSASCVFVSSVPPL